MDKYGYGDAGETLAKDYLQKKGYVIVDENISFPNVGEIDLICKDGNTLVFVEVRARSDLRFGDPLASITKDKIRKIVAASRRYLYTHEKRYGGYRYDAIGIIGENVTHVENAFYAHW